MCLEFICEGCGTDFKSQFDLDSHMESVHRRVVKRDCIYRCTHCQVRLKSFANTQNFLKSLKLYFSGSLQLALGLARACEGTQR